MGIAKTTAEMLAELALKAKKPSKAENIKMGLYHPIGGGKKLTRPIQDMGIKSVDNPNMPLVPKKTINYEDMVGGAGVPLTVDRSGAGKLIQKVGGEPLIREVPTQGGIDYTRWNEAFASLPNVANRYGNQIQEASKMKGVDPDKIFGLSNLMSHTAVDFSHQPMEVLLNQFDPTLLDKKRVKEFNTSVQNHPVVNQKTKKTTYPFKNFAGIETPEGRYQLLETSNYGGELRKNVMHKMNLDSFADMEFPSIAEARTAITEPRLLEEPTASVGHNIARFNPEGIVTYETDKPHYSYTGVIKAHPTEGGYAGEAEQTLPMKDVFQQYFDIRRALDKPEGSDLRALSMSIPIQKFDNEWLDRVKKAQEKKEYAIKNGLPFKDGGVVPEGTVTLEELDTTPQSPLEQVVSKEKETPIAPTEQYSDPMGNIVPVSDTPSNDEMKFALLQKPLIRGQRTREGRMVDPTEDVFGGLKLFGKATADEAKGLASTIVGLPGDIEGLGRTIINAISPEAVGNESFLPPTEKVYDSLPNLYQGQGNYESSVPAQLSANILGSMIDPLKVGMATAKLGTKGAKVAGKEIGQYGANKLEDFLQQQGLISNVVPEGKTITQPFSPKDEFGFYSKLEKEAQNIPRKQGNGQAFLNEFKKLQVTPNELEATGMADFLKSKNNFTRDEVIDYAKQNRPVMNEKVLQKNLDNLKVVEMPQQNYTNLFNGDKILSSYEIKHGNDYVSTMHKTIDDDGKVNYVIEELLDGPFDSEKEAISTLKEEINYQMQQEGESYPSFPKHENHYRTKGGENYRELLVTLPERNDAASNINKSGLKVNTKYDRPESNRRDIEIVDENGVLQGQMSQFRGTDEEAIDDFLENLEYQNRNNKTKNNNNFVGGHYEDHPNTMINMRMDDRIDVDGKRGTLLDELQSDWHQSGKQKGYGNPKLTDEESIEYSKLLDKGRRNLSETKAQRLAELGDKLAKSKVGVPNVPYKETWHELGLKKAIQHAVERGDDRLYLSTGDTLADRYDLSKQINELSYKPLNNDYYQIQAIDKNNHPAVSNNYHKDNLASVVGKDLAKKIINGEGDVDNFGNKTFTGLDLKVGGEGMRKYYDEIYPSYLRKFAKQYGGHVGETEVYDFKPQYFIGDDEKKMMHYAAFDSKKEAENFLQNSSGPLKEHGKVIEYPRQKTKTYYYEPSPEAKKKIMGGLPYKDGGQVQSFADGGSVETDQSLPLQAHLRHFISPDLMDVQDLGVTGRTNDGAITLGRQIASKNLEDENPNMRFKQGMDYGQYSTPFHEGQINARVMKNPEKPDVQAMLQYLQSVGKGTVGLGLMGNRTSEGDKLRALTMMYNQQIDPTSEISGMATLPFGQSPMFNVQYKKRFAEGGDVKKVHPALEKLIEEYVTNKKPNPARQTINEQLGRETIKLPMLHPQKPPTVGLGAGLNLEGNKAMPNSQMELFKRKGGKVKKYALGGSVAKMALELAQKQPKKIIMGAERQANLDKFLNKSAVKKPVYHGTYNDFNKFDKSKIGENFGVDKKGFFFTSNPKVAGDLYASPHDMVGNETEGGNIIKSHLNIENPLYVPVLSAKSNTDLIDHYDLHKDTLLNNAEKNNRDGILLYHPTKPSIGEMYTVFEPTQIKSAIGNEGTFDPTNPELNKKNGGKVSIDEMKYALTRKR
jgi:hypothetical protein